MPKDRSRAVADVPGRSVTRLPLPGAPHGNSSVPRAEMPVGSSCYLLSHASSPGYTINTCIVCQHAGATCLGQAAQTRSTAKEKGDTCVGTNTDAVKASELPQAPSSCSTVTQTLPAAALLAVGCCALGNRVLWADVTPSFMLCCILFHGAPFPEA